MKHTFRIALYFDAIQMHEPFTALEIRAVRIVDGEAIWVSFNDLRGDFFSVYGISSNDELAHCIADCLDLETARKLASTFQAFANFSLSIIEHPNL